MAGAGVLVFVFILAVWPGVGSRDFRIVASAYEYGSNV
jgi:hypothetical protein